LLGFFLLLITGLARALQYPKLETGPVRLEESEVSYVLVPISTRGYWQRPDCVHRNGFFAGGFRML
jgi:hypothetical protein